MPVVTHLTKQFHVILWGPKAEHHIFKSPRLRAIPLSVQHNPNIHSLSKIQFTTYSLSSTSRPQNSLLATRTLYVLLICPTLNLTHWHTYFNGCGTSAGFDDVIYADGSEMSRDIFWHLFLILNLLLRCMFIKYPELLC